MEFEWVAFGIVVALLENLKILMDEFENSDG